MGLRFALILTVVVSAGIVCGVPAADRWSGLPGDPPQPQLPAASVPAPIPPSAGNGQIHPTRCRFYHDRDVLVIGTTLIVLTGACALLRRVPRAQG